MLPRGARRGDAAGRGPGAARVPRELCYKVMLAVHLENGAVAVRNVPLPVRPKGHALLRLLCGGICNTDLELQRGYYGFAGTPGHEFVAEVAEAEDRRLNGRRVVGEIDLACTACEWCRQGLGRHCPNRTVLGIVGHSGAFSEFFTLPERNLRALDDAIPTGRAVFTEPLAAACEILKQVAIPPGDPVAVLGDGKLGLLAAMVLQAHGCPVRLLGHHEHKTAHRRRGRSGLRDRARPSAHGRPTHGRIPMGGGGYREPRRIAGRGKLVPAARHRHSEIDRAWRGSGGYRAHRGQRNHAGGIALRPL